MDDDEDEIRNLHDIGDEPIVLPTMHGMAAPATAQDSVFFPEFHSVDVLNNRLQGHGNVRDDAVLYRGDAATIGGITAKEFAAWRQARPAPLLLSALLEGRATKAQSPFEFEKSSISISRPAVELVAQLSRDERLLVDLTGGAGSTLFVFDWDDTLCPSTWMDDVGLAYDNPQVVERTPEIEKYNEAVRAVLQTARSCGDVHIVTFAERPWVDKLISCFFPSQDHDILDRLGITVEYAREIPISEDQDPWPRKLCSASAHRGRVEWLVAQKREAMRKFVDGGDYSSVVSIGDGIFEALAVHDLAVSDDTSRLITKSVKLPIEPMIEEITQALGLILDGLPDVIAKETSFHVDMVDLLPLQGGDALASLVAPATSADILQLLASIEVRA
jgi:hypothetical protein